MKNLMTLLIVAVFAAFTLSSCGGGDNNAKTSSTPAKTHEEKPEPKPAAEPAAKGGEGQAIFDKSCHVCHKAGVAGAAATEGDNLDKARWETMAAKGLATLKKNAISGFTGDFGAMPAKGTCADCSDEQIEAAIKFMFDKVGVAVK